MSLKVATDLLESLRATIEIIKNGPTSRTLSDAGIVNQFDTRDILLYYL